MADLSKLSKPALRAYMRGGTPEWGTHGDADAHVRYAEPVNPRSRRRCTCGCKQRATHIGMANGVGLTTGCQLSIARWVRNPADHRHGSRR